MPVITLPTPGGSEDVWAPLLNTAIETVNAAVDAQDTGKLNTSDAPELIRDTIGATLVAGANVTLTVNDAGNTITIASTGGGGGSGGVPDDNSVTSAKIVDGAIVDADINASAAIAQSKISGLTAALAAKVDKLTDPNADRIRFWDDSAGAEAYLTVGTGLSISGTTLSNTGTPGSATSLHIEMSGGYYDFPSTIPAGVIRIFTYGPTEPTSANVKINGTISTTLPTYIGTGAGTARHDWLYDARVG